MRPYLEKTHHRKGLVEWLKLQYHKNKTKKQQK
jgi:hypothetical protein